MSLEELKQAKITWEKKRAYYELELGINSSPDQKFELRQRIDQCQQEIERLEKIINSSGSVNYPEIKDNLNQLNFPQVIRTYLELLEKERCRERLSKLSQTGKSF